MMSAQIPAEGMHSFEAQNNEINWHIAVSIKVADAPDFDLSFPLRVVPPGLYS